MQVELGVVIPMVIASLSSFDLYFHFLFSDGDVPLSLSVTSRGVVQLFNAVKQQQGKIKEKVKEVKKSVRKTDKVRQLLTSTMSNLELFMS